MSNTYYIEVHDPTVNVKKMDHKDKCISLETMIGNATLILHFDKPDDMKAYVGLLNMAMDAVK